MNDSARVLGGGCGPLDSVAMFVGEAPGRLGADESQLPFHGDKSGRNFESLLDHVGLDRHQLFVTNAVLCNPKATSGNNATPTAIEISNCSPFLREQIEIVNPKVVVTLGAVALKATAVLEPHDQSVGQSVRTVRRWTNRLLVPAYHPGQRAMIHRSYTNQISDYQFIAETIRRSLAGGTRKGTSRSRENSVKVAEVARRIVKRKGKLTYFALHKLFFLAEVRYLEGKGKRLTKAYIVRQKDGPYCTDLHVAKLPAILPSAKFHRSNTALVIEDHGQRRLFDEPSSDALSAEEATSIDRTVDRYAQMSDAELKTAAYLTEPMRKLLRREKNGRTNTFNSPVLGSL